MTAQNLISLVRRSTADQVIDGREISNILAEAGNDGVITDGEKKMLRALLAGNNDSLTEEGRAVLTRFLKEFSDAGDQRVITTRGAVATLENNFSLIARGDQEISRADLQATIDSPESSEQLVRSARWLLNRFNDYSNLAGTRGDDKMRPADGKISRRDLQIGEKFTNMSRLEAYEILRANWNAIDTAGGTAERDDDANIYNLAAMVRTPGASEELKAACRFLMGNEEAFAILDGGHNGVEGGLFRLNDLDAAIAREKSSNRQIVANLIERFDDLDQRNSGLFWMFKSGAVTKNELEHFIRHTSANSAEAAAARALVDNDELWDQIAGADGDISLEDLRDYANAAGTTATTPDMNASDLAPTAAVTIPASELPTTVDGQRAALMTVSQSYPSLDPDGNGIKRRDLQRIIDSTGAKQELRVAAQFLLSQFDNVAGSDAKISAEDLDVAESRLGLMPTRALEVLRTNLDDVAVGGFFDRARLLAVASDPNASVELRAAAQLVAGDQPLFDRIDNFAQGGRRDGKITSADLDVAISVGDMSDNRAAELIAFNFAAIQSVSGQARDGGINVDDLRTVSENSHDPELKSAAIHALRSGLFDRIRRFGFERGSQSGLVSNEDLREFMRATPLSRTTIGQPEPLPSTSATNGAQAVPPQTVRSGQPARNAAIGDTNSLYREIDSVLGDPTLTVEDKVAFVLLLLCKYMDKQIELQMKHIQKLQLAYGQAQERQRQEKAAQQAGTDAPAPTESSTAGEVDAQTIDTEVMKLKRLVDKRGQVFDIMRQIIDKYNQTAKSMIDTVGR